MERQKQRTSIHWFTPDMSPTTKATPAWSKEPGDPSRSEYRTSSAQTILHCFHRHINKTEQPGLKQATIWDAHTADGSLTRNNTPAWKEKVLKKIAFLKISSYPWIQKEWASFWPFSIFSEETHEFKRILSLICFLSLSHTHNFI